MSTQWHELQSDHNKKASDLMNSKNPTFVDWEVTTLFYSILHLVDDYFENNGPRLPLNHQDRNRLVRNSLTTIYPDYHKLYSLSIRSRYTVGFRIPQSDRDTAKRLHTAIETAL